MIYVTINSDALTSGAFTLPDPSRRHALAVPSMTAALVALQFTTTSGTAPFLPLHREDGSGQIHTVYSGTGPGIAVLPPLPTPWGRLAVSSGTASQVTTFTLLPLSIRW